MNFTVLALAIVATAAMSTTQVVEYEVILHAESEWSGSGPLLAKYWHPDADSFLVVYAASGPLFSDIRFFRIPPEDTIYRGQAVLHMPFDKLAGAQFSHDGSRLLAWGTTITNIGVFEVGTWDLIYQTNLDSLNTTLNRVFYSAISPSGDTLWVPDREGIAGIKIETGEKFVIDIKPDSIGYLVRSVSPDGRYLNGVATKVLGADPSYELPDNRKHFLHDLVTGETVFSIVESDTLRNNGVPTQPVFFAPEPGFYYEPGWTDGKPVLRKRSLPDRNALSEWPMTQHPILTIDFSHSGEWMVIGSGTPVIGYDARIYHRDPFYLAGHVSDSSSNFHLGSVMGMFSPDDKWFAGFTPGEQFGQLQFFSVNRRTVSVAEGVVSGSVSSVVRAVPNTILSGSDITLQSTWSGAAEILIVDAAGRVVLTDNAVFESGVSVVLDVNGSRLTPGRYFILVRNDEHGSTPLSLIVR